MATAISDACPIVAIATAAGRGAIGVVRVSGTGLRSLSEALTGRQLRAREASYCAFRDAEGGAIDQGLALWFEAPHSYTGEDVLELQGHGGPVVMQLILRRVLELGEPLGIRLAEPGEFTQRAFLNDKLDLAQAEAVADLIDASTERAARSASRSLAGEFSRRVHALAGELVELRMLVEATLDFPEEEVDFLQAADAQGRIERCAQDLSSVQASARRGALLREGLTVVLVGEPNVGKSSLLNALAGAELAIVTPVPGTTRDRIVQAIQIEGVAVNVIDTAGLRETSDEVERVGIARTWESVREADCVLHLLDAREVVAGGYSVPERAQAIERELWTRLPRSVPCLRVCNKTDLIDVAVLPERLVGDAETAVLWMSARSGQGVDRLRERLLVLAGGEPGAETLFTARERHLRALAAAADRLEVAQALAARGAAQLDMLAEELRLAHEALGRITGAFSADDLLGEIFSRFCIGK